MLFSLNNANRQRSPWKLRVCPPWPRAPFRKAARRIPGFRQWWPLAVSLPVTVLVLRFRPESRSRLLAAPRSVCLLLVLPFGFCVPSPASRPLLLASTRGFATTTWWWRRDRGHASSLSCSGATAALPTQSVPAEQSRRPPGPVTAPPASPHVPRAGPPACSCAGTPEAS